MTQQRELNALDKLVIEHLAETGLKEFAPTPQQRQSIIDHVRKAHGGLYTEEYKHIIATIEGKFDPSQHA